MNIHPYLIARLYAIHKAFYDSCEQIPLYYPGPHTNQPPPMPPPHIPFSAHDEEDEEGEGGGGTLKGLRVITEPKSSPHRP